MFNKFKANYDDVNLLSSPTDALTGETKLVDVLTTVDDNNGDILIKTEVKYIIFYDMLPFMNVIYSMSRSVSIILFYF